MKSKEYSNYLRKLGVIHIRNFVAEYKTFLIRPRVFLSLSTAGHVHHGASVGPGRAPWRVLWAFKVANLAINRGIAFRPARAIQAHANPQEVFFFLVHLFQLSLLLFLKYQISRQRLGSHGTTAALQAFAFVTATNGAFACGFVRVRVCACVIVGSYSSSNQEHSLKNRGAIQLLLLFFIFAMLSAAVCLYHTISF